MHDQNRRKAVRPRRGGTITRREPFWCIVIPAIFIVIGLAIWAAIHGIRQKEAEWVKARSQQIERSY